MPFTAYSNVQASIETWVHRGDVSANSSIVAECITLAEARINRELRVRQMETTISTVIASGTIAVPTNYIELKNAYVANGDEQDRLQRKTAEWIYDHYPQRTSDDVPIAIAR